MEQRSYVNELLLVVLVAAFVVACAAILNVVHRALPTSVSAAIGTPSTSSASALATSTPLTTLETPTPAAGTRPVVAPSPTAHPTAQATPSLDQYSLITGHQLGAAPDRFVGKKIAISGSVYYVDPRGSTTWVQVLTADNVYVDVNFPAPESVQRGQQVRVYGIGAGTTVIRASNGNLYTQPFINPGQFIQKS
ncbi:MAG: hypothetical protein M1118_07895 [Chloroflexi bacterium]|nr:hypothetical protein [Chloroflexota bacterium]